MIEIGIGADERAVARNHTLQRWRQLAVMQSERRFDQGRDAGGRIEMSDIAFDRTDGTESDPVRMGAKHLRERGDFDLMAAEA